MGNWYHIPIVCLSVKFLILSSTERRFGFGFGLSYSVLDRTTYCNGISTDDKPDTRWVLLSKIIFDWSPIFIFIIVEEYHFFVTITGRHHEQRRNTIEIDTRQPLKNNQPEYGAKIRNIQDNVDEALVESRRSRPANDHTPGSKTRNDDRHNAGKQRSVRHLGATGRGYFFWDTSRTKGGSHDEQATSRCTLANQPALTV
jgi:hypothetical protein